MSAGVGEGPGRPNCAAPLAPRTTPCFTLSPTRANTLVGSTRASRNDPAWRQTYRALEHGHARRQCSDRSAMSRFPAGVRAFGRVFTDIQQERHFADYDPDARFIRSYVLHLIDEAERYITLFEAVPASIHRPFSIHVLLRPRRG